MHALPLLVCTLLLTEARAHCACAAGEDLCSLHEKVDRLAFSVLWTMDEEANVLATSFHKTVCNPAWRT